MQAKLQFNGKPCALLMANISKRTLAKKYRTSRAHALHQNNKVQFYCENAHKQKTRCTIAPAINNTPTQGQRYYGTMFPGLPRRVETQKDTLINHKIVIIDEISFASANTLEKVNNHLQQQTSTSSSAFREVNFITVGDFHQLKPVRTSGCFRDDGK